MNEVMSNRRPVIVFHGGPGLAREYLVPHLEFLNESHQVYSFEYNGGTLKEIFDQLNRDIEGAHINQPVDIVAHSWGSFVLFRLMRDYGFGHLRRVVFVTPCPVKWDQLDHSFQRFHLMMEEYLTAEVRKRLKELQPDGNGPMDQEMIRLLKPCYVFDRKFVQELKFNTYNRKIHAAVTEEMKGYDFKRELELIRKKYSIVVGEKDFFQMEDLGEFVLGAKEVIRLEKIGHSPFVECPQDFANLVRRLL